MVMIGSLFAGHNVKVLVKSVELMEVFQKSTMDLLQSIKALIRTSKEEDFIA